MFLKVMLRIKNPDQLKDATIQRPILNNCWLFSVLGKWLLAFSSRGEISFNQIIPLVFKKLVSALHEDCQSVWFYDGGKKLETRVYKGWYLKSSPRFIWK